MIDQTPTAGAAGFDETDEFARAIFDALAEGVLVVDHRGRIVAMNPSAERVLGHLRSALVGKNVRDSPLILEDESELQIPVEQWPIVETLETGAPAGRLLVTLRPDGARRVIVMIAMPLPRPSEKRWTVVSFVDVTRERRAELALSASERRFRQLVEQAPDPVIVVNAAGEIQQCNQRTGDVFGYTTEELDGMPFDTLVPDAARAMGKGAELSGWRRDGTPFPIEVSLGPFETADGPALIAIARDLTERRRAVEVAQAERAKSEFLSRMSHELRTPLNSVLGFAQLLELGRPRPDQVEAIEQIKRAGRHLLDLLNDLLEFERVRAGAVSFSIEPVRVDDVVSEALRLVDPLARECDVSVEATPPAEPGGAWAACDRQRLHQILLNLISNAIKYNRRGGRVVVAVAADAEIVTASVTDTGPGIEPHLVARLFVPFERLGADAGSVQGAGVGLALSKMLAEGMRGSIAVRTAVGRGSTFALRMPRAEPLPESTPAPPVPFGVRLGDRLHDLTVLSIEDNAANVLLMESLLEAFHVGRSFTAHTAVEGIEVARTERPDCVLLDLHLSDQPGEFVIEQLRQHSETSAIPVVVVTADATPASRERLRSLGVVDYLTKPVDVMALYDAIERTKLAH